MNTYTLELGEVRRGDVALAGGKGASLGELTASGFPVPAGFVVTTRAYTDFIDDSGLADTDRRQLGELMARQPVPDRIGAPILEAYRALGSPAVAVRSSGTAEDLAGASFAGQHDTFLNVTAEEALLAAVRDCWASLWTPRAVAYRKRYGWDERGLALAVVVQTMVDATWAGVLFTADPVTGRRDRVVVEAVRGLGEALVSGTATGHRHLVDKATGRLLTGDSPLPPGVLNELVRLGAEVEEMDGSPQDIEWTWAEGRCSLVQARPLTALPDEPASATAADEGRRRKPPRIPKTGAGIAADHVPYPPYPMDVSLDVRPAIAGLLAAVRSTGLRVPPVDDVLIELDDGVVQLVPPSPRPTPSMLVRLPAALPKLARLLRTRPSDWLARCDATLISLADRIDAEDLSDLPDRAIIDRIVALRDTQGALLPSRFGGAVPGLLVADPLAKAVLGLAAGKEHADRIHTDLMAGIPSLTRDANTALEALAATIRETPDLLRVYREEEPGHIVDALRGSAPGRALLDDVQAYLRRYGRRQISVPLPGFPSLREAPEAVHGMLKGLTRANPGSRDSGDETARAERARAVLTARGSVRTRTLAPLALKLVAAARTGVGFREDSHVLLFMDPATVTRRLLLELGRRLTERHVLDHPTDVFYLRIDEVAASPAETARATVDRRKKAREAALDGYTFVPGEMPHSTGSEEAVHGTPASRGTATGTVRVIRDESDFARLGSGDVLVCPYTNPAWTPLFSLASAVVVDAGGVASHAAIVAREYGIPAVMGTGIGTQLLAEGQRVVVDGGNGTVTVCADRPATAPAVAAL